MQATAEYRTVVTNLMYVNATLSAQVNEGTNHLSSQESKIAVLKKTTTNLQGKMRNLKRKTQSPLKKNQSQPSDKKAYAHPKWWRSLYCWIHAFRYYEIRDCSEKA